MADNSVDTNDVSPHKNGIVAISNSVRHGLAFFVGGVFGSLVGYQSGVVINTLFQVASGAAVTVGSIISGPLVLVELALGFGVGGLGGAMISYLYDMF